MINSVILAVIIIVFIFILVPVNFVIRHLYLKKYPNKFCPGNFGLDFEEIKLLNNENLKLAGWFIPAIPAKGTVLLCHGLGANRSCLLEVAVMFHQSGYDVYIFDFRGHGDSAGSKISYGYKEKEDLKVIIDYIKTTGIKEIGIYGISMGGAIAILAAYEIPEIKVIIADSPFVSIENIINYRMSRFFPALISNFMVWVIDIFIQFIFRVPLQEISPIKAIREIRKPVLFIAGDQDRNIPVENSKILYEVANDPKEIIIMPGYNHIETMDAPEYKDLVTGFMDKYLVIYN